MILNQIQQQLENLYQIERGEKVEGFLKKIGPRLGREALLVKFSSRGLELGLYISPKILDQLKQQNPFQSLGLHNLEAFLIAVEGVSHFVYFLKRAKENCAVTQLEMEIQAEIDKYLLVCFFYLFHGHRIPPFLFSRLFDEVRWEPSLKKEARERYIEANKFAARFCAHLNENFIRQSRWQEAIECSRRFYHLHHWDKLRLLMP